MVLITVAITSGCGNYHFACGHEALSRRQSCTDSIFDGNGRGNPWFFRFLQNKKSERVYIHIYIYTYIHIYIYTYIHIYIYTYIHIYIYTYIHIYIYTYIHIYIYTYIHIYIYTYIHIYIYTYIHIYIYTYIHCECGVHVHTMSTLSCAMCSFLARRPSSICSGGWERPTGELRRKRDHWVTGIILGSIGQANRNRNNWQGQHFLYTGADSHW